MCEQLPDITVLIINWGIVHTNEKQMFLQVLYNGEKSLQNVLITANQGYCPFINVQNQPQQSTHDEHCWIHNNTGNIQNQNHY